MQQKHEQQETGSAYSGCESQDRKVVWPAPGPGRGRAERTPEPGRSFKQAAAPWQQPAEEEPLRPRVSRSRSRSKNIMERARSFERAAAETVVSRPASRASHRSPSGPRAGGEDWAGAGLERPASRTDVDSRRFGEIGRVAVADWEQRIRGGVESAAVPRTPPPRRRELPARREERGGVETPEPPPPPARTTYPPQPLR